MVNIIGQRIISPGVQSEIPCVNCDTGQYEAHCVTMLDGDSYQVLTCRDCSNWHYYDHYVEGRLVVQDHVGLDRCEWRVCPVSELQYMVRLQNGDSLTRADEITALYVEAGEDRDKLVALVSDLCELELWDAEALSLAEIKRRIEGWIDENGS